MSRLIDADKLIERMKEDTSEAKKSLSQDNYVDKEVWGRVIQIIESYIDIIDNLPSAYDIDNVIEQLEEKSITFETAFTVKEHKWNLTNDAIEIVKAGGIDE
jgi:hypothetical protein